MNSASKTEDQENPGYVATEFTWIKKEWIDCCSSDNVQLYLLLQVLETIAFKGNLIIGISYINEMS